MKKIVFAAISAALIGSACTVSGRIYTNPASVVSSDGTRTTCIDSRGNVWAYTSDGSENRGDEIILIMDNRGTPEIRDDVVITVK